MFNQSPRKRNQVSQPNQFKFTFVIYVCMYIHIYVYIYIACIFFFTEVIYSFLALGVVVKNQGSRVGNGSVGKNPGWVGMETWAPIPSVCGKVVPSYPELYSKHWMIETGRPDPRSLWASRPSWNGQLLGQWETTFPKTRRDSRVEDYWTPFSSSCLPVHRHAHYPPPMYVLSQHTHRRMRVLDLDSLIDVTVIPLTNMRLGMVSQSLNSVAWES